jgi:outer membrane protein assembly factor BamD (BamD/ComL family)
MSEVLYTIIGFLMLLGVIAFLGWLLWRSLQRSVDPPKLIVKWIGTLLIAAVLVLILGGWGPSYGSAFTVPFVCVLLGICLSLIWAPSVGDILARPITSLFDGGMEEAKPEPLYSTAQAKRKKGQYQEALWAVQQQLEQFPDDYTGHLLMAEIQAEDLKDLPAAQATIQRFCLPPDRPPAHVGGALIQLADWQIKHAQDIEGARQSLQQILERLPNSTWAYAANQRLAHLANPEYLLASQDRRAVPVPTAKAVPGIPRPPPPAVEPRESSAEVAQQLVKHLQQFPEDNEAREELAGLYARHFQRLDLAALELEQLIAQPNAPARRVVHWLNLLADWLIEQAQNEEAARQTLQRIIDLYPDQAAAQRAQQRQAHLKLELRKSEATHSLKLGTYEQDLGLKHPPPWQGGAQPKTAEDPPAQAG